MFPLLAPLITGGASLLGSIFNSQTNAQNTQAQLAAQQQMQTQTEQFNAQQADINRQFQAGQVQQQEDYATQMSNTAYQRASQDMQKAGLNPMMMFGSGSAASAPQGSTASGSTASVGTPSVPMSQRQSPLAGLGAAAATAVDTMVKDKQIDYLSSQVARTNVDTSLQEAKLPGARAQMELDQYFKAFLENRPSIAEAIGVGPHIGSAIDETLKPGFDAVSSVYGGLGRALSGLFSSAKSAGSEANAVRRGMDLERGVEASSTNSAASVDRGLSMSDKFDNMMKGGSKGLENLLDRWMTGGSKLGGRNPGTGGSYD